MFTPIANIDAISLSVVLFQQKNPASCLVHLPDRKLVPHFPGVFLPEKVAELPISGDSFTPNVLIAGGQPTGRVGEGIC